MKSFKYKRYWPLLIALLIITPTLFLITENIGRSFFIIFSVIFWILGCFFTRNYVLASFLYILFVLPFNITLLLPSSVEIFNTVSIEIFPYVDGLYSNYLVPTFSIVDIGVLLLIVAVFFDKGFKRILKGLKIFRDPLLVVILFLVVQNIVLADFLVVFNTVRLIMYMLALLVFVSWLKKDWRNGFWKYVVCVLIVNILVQGVIGVLQLSTGASIGLEWLGESQVVNGMLGSSFISLKDQVYLRAYGTFPHPNVLGGFLIISFVIGWIASLNLKKIWRICSYVLMILSVLVSIITFSRVAITVLFIGVAIFVVTKLREEKIFSFSGGLLFERYMNLFTAGDTSWIDRSNLIDVSVRIVKSKTLLGTGIGNFVKYMEGMVPQTDGGLLLLQPVHNIFLLTLAEFGILGILPFVYLLVRFFVRVVDWRENFPTKVFILMAFLVVGMFDHYLVSLPQGWVISLLLFAGLVF